MACFEVIIKNMRSNAFQQPKPTRPNEMTDAIASFTKHAERIALLESLVASIEATPTSSPTISLLTPATLPELLVCPPPPTSQKKEVKKRPLPSLPPPHLRYRRAKWEISPGPSELPTPFAPVPTKSLKGGVKRRPLPPLPPPHMRYRRSVWEISPDPSELPVPSAQNPTGPLPDAQNYARSNEAGPPTPLTGLPPTTQGTSSNSTRPEANNTITTPICGSANAGTTEPQNSSV